MVAESGPEEEVARHRLSSSNERVEEATPLVRGPAKTYQASVTSLGANYSNQPSFLASILDAPYALHGWFQMLVNEYGYKLLILLFASQHVMKGVVSGMTGQSSLFLFKSYNVAGPQMQIFSGVVALPWALKPIIGMISDLCPIRGLNKAPYILLSSLFGVAAFVFIGLGTNRIPVEGTVMAMFFISLQASTCDLLTEAKYAEQLNAKPQYGPDLMTFVWGGINCGGIVALLGIGWLISTYGARTAYMVAVFPASFILYPTLKNYMQERPRFPEETERARAQMLEQREAFFLCVLMLFATLLLMAIGMTTKDSRTHLYGALFVMFMVLASFTLVLRPVIAKINAFFLIQTSLSVAIGGSTFYFYTDTPKQYPDGPHFSIEFFTTVLGLVGSLFSLVGLGLYNRYMKEWSYQTLLLMSNLLISVLSLGDILIYTRYNLKMGIPDHVFVLGSSVTGTIIQQWQWMPGVVMLSQLCPKGMEATMYALLAGCHNLGGTLSQYLGAFILEELNIKPAGHDNEGAQFDNLWIASFIGTALPALTLILVPFMIPKARQTDKLLEDHDRSATVGSLWKRWTQNDVNVSGEAGPESENFRDHARL